ncbi:MAG TPA: DOPA 4,5-dioxygenase family protein [Telluria sp.]|nr:DOPA 4,5-dioxygenase family protein [Telluria sp.]
MSDPNAPYHAHVYYEAATRERALALHAALGGGALPGILMVGRMEDSPVGPHPLPQFEFHFYAATVPAVCALLEATGLTALIHPLTDDDLADHTTLAQWIGTPLPLDPSVFDPPGHNQGFARFGRAEF